MIRKILLGGVIALTLILGAGWGWLQWYASASQDAAFFEDEIRAFELADQENPPPDDTVIFVGSSSIRLWDTLDRDMAPLVVRNRGFGGSQLAHLNVFARRILSPHRPQAVVVYAGDNDLDARTGKTAEVVLADFQELVGILREDTPETRVYYLSIKPSKQRWSRWPEISRANADIRAHCAEDPRLTFVDLSTVLLGEDGEPRDDVFIVDGLHLSPTGYAEWTRVLRPLLLGDLLPDETAASGTLPSGGNDATRDL